MRTESDIYKKLAEHIDHMPVAYPATESGVELRILKHLFTPEEAEIALSLSALPESIDKIYKRVRKTGISREKLVETLDGLVAKGAILGGKLFKSKGKGKFYSKAQLAIGMHEFQVNRMTKQYAKDIKQYKDEAFSEAFVTPKTSQMRTIPIKSCVTPERHIGNYDDIRQIVMEVNGEIAVMNCVCGQVKAELGEPCIQSESLERCITFNEVAEFMIELGIAHSITKEKCLEILNKGETEGLVLQPENAQKPSFVCSCCSCCCGVFYDLKKFPRPAEYWHTNYFAQVDVEACEGCKKCVERCPMEAVSIEDEISVVNLDRCIGCGLCTSTCPSNAINLKKKSRETAPAKDHDSLYRKIMMERLRTVEKLKMMGKMMTGKKI